VVAGWLADRLCQPNPHGYEPELWMMNADGSNQRRVVRALSGASDPVWAPI